MKHKFEFSDIECLTILEALNYLIANEEIHPLDRKSSMDIESKILETVRKDKGDNGN